NGSGTCAANTDFGGRGVERHVCGASGDGPAGAYGHAPVWHGRAEDARSGSGVGGGRIEDCGGGNHGSDSKIAGGLARVEEIGTRSGAAETGAGDYGGFARVQLWAGATAEKTERAECVLHQPTDLGLASGKNEMDSAAV